MKNHNRYYIIAVFFVLLTILVNCGNRTKVYDDPQLAFQQAQHAYNRGKYNKAILVLEKFVFDFPGSDLVDDAHMLLGKCYFREKDYILAAGEFKRLFENFSESEYAEEAEYMVGLCYYLESPRVELDQEYTLRAIEWMENFIEYYPHSDYTARADSVLQLCREKLAEKEYKNAKLYLKMKKFTAAITYANILVEEYPDSKFICPSYLVLAQSHLELQDLENAKKYFNMVLDNCGNDEELMEESAKKLKDLVH